MIKDEKRINTRSKINKQIAIM